LGGSEAKPLGGTRGLDFATDNSTAEAAFTKGRSSSPELDEMVLELRELALMGGFMLRLFHVAGMRMIAMGIDDASRGKLDVGALLREGDSSSVPLHLGPVKRSLTIETWVKSWAKMDAKVATPADWLYEAQQAGEHDYPLPSKTWIWSLPPAAALYAIEELGNGPFKHHEWMTGMVLVLLLLKPEWFRRFHRVVDFHFVVPAGAADSWPAWMHEPPTVGIYLPLLRYQPWGWRAVPFLVPFSFSMSAMYKAGDSSTGSVLREFWEARVWIASMLERLVRDLLQSRSWRQFLDIS